MRLLPSASTCVAGWAASRPMRCLIVDVPYPQLWAARHGFQPGLSILDLLMNEGREAIFTLQKMLMRGG